MNTIASSPPSIATPAVPLRWLALSVGGSLLVALAVRSFKNRPWEAGWQLFPALVAPSVPTIVRHGPPLELL